MSLDQYKTNVEVVKRWKTRVTEGKTEIYETVKDYAKDYMNMDVVTIDGVERLIKKRACEDDPMLFFITNEDLFDTIQQVHLSNDHVGITKLMVILKKKYANITRECASQYLSYCVECVSHGRF